MTNSFYLRRCFDLAKLSGNNHAPNPRVGALIVYNPPQSNKSIIIGEGFHHKYGGPHAEVNAINNVAKKDLILLGKSTIYVSLEPCYHEGKTPPCVDLILKHKIPRVVIGCKDPNPKVAGKSIQKLRENGVEVITNVLASEAIDLVQPFIKSIRKKTPYIILKWAQSSDGFIGQKNKQVWISNAVTKRLTHKWRAASDAIMVGTNTAITDNPQLNTRLYYGKNPLRIVPDRLDRLSDDLHLLDQQIPTWVLRSNSSAPKSNQPNLTYIPTSFDKKMLPFLLQQLHKHGVTTLFVEGGAQLIQNFIDQSLWDEARIFISPNYLQNGILAPEVSKSTSAVKRYDLGNNQLEVVRKSPRINNFG